MEPISFVWLRRDLRLQDNTALNQALAYGHPVLPIFIFDRNILDDLPDKKDRRVTFIYKTLESLKRELRDLGSDLLVRYGDPIQVWGELTHKYKIKSVFFNRDYEPYAKERDARVSDQLVQKGISVFNFKDHVIFESHEVSKDDGSPYTVFTPYKKRWLSRFTDIHSASGKLDPVKPQNDYSKFCSLQFENTLKLEDFGFQSVEFEFPLPEMLGDRMKIYDRTRDYPALDGTSRLGVHLRFGTISIRSLVNQAISQNQVFLSELIWREFYSQILDRFPRVVRESFRPEYDRIEWRNADGEFEKWCEGKTGFPMVDAGMRQLNTTGYMHNRVRMVTASFLTKHLLIDWRRGEAYFARHLLDYDLASNNGGWQWSAGCGTDAAPYFRIFNPSSQHARFDPDSKYISRWVPEWQDLNYRPMLDHETARNRCLQTYKKVLG